MGDLNGLYITGADELFESLGQILDGEAQTRKDACLAGAELVAERARELAPEKSGNMVTKIVAIPDGEGAIVVGSAPYTEVQETNDSFHHPNGGQAHFLQTALEESSEAITGSHAAAYQAQIEKLGGGK